MTDWSKITHETPEIELQGFWRPTEEEIQWLFNNGKGRSYLVASQRERKFSMDGVKTEPVLTAGVLIGLIMAAFGVAMEMDWVSLTPDQLGAWELLIKIAVPVAVALVGNIIARRYVTSLAKPKDKDGNELMSMTEWDMRNHK